MDTMILPTEILLQIFSFLSQKDLYYVLSRVCKTWRDVCHCSKLWRTVHFSQVYHDCNLTKGIRDHFTHISTCIYCLDIRCKELEVVFRFTANLNFQNVKTLMLGDEGELSAGDSDGFFETVVARFPNLKHVSFGSNSLTSFGGFFRSMSPLQLEGIQIRSSRYELEGFDHDLLLFASNNANLKKISLRLSERIQFDTYVKVLEKFPALTDLDVCSEFSLEVFAASTVPLQLTKVFIFDSDFKSNGIEKLFERSKNLLSLEVPKIRQIDMRHLFKNCHFLQELEIGTSLTDTHLRQLGKNCPNLIKLSVFIKTANDAAVKALVKSCKDLKSLNLKMCLNITDQSMRAIGEHCRYLQNVEFSGGKLITLSGIVCLISSCQLLKSFSLMCCDAIRSGSSVISHGSVDVGMHSHLNELRLQSCRNVCNNTVLTLANLCPDLREIDLLFTGVNANEEFYRKLYDLCKFKPKCKF